MERAVRMRVALPMLTAACAAGLTLALGSSAPAMAEPAVVSALPPVTTTDGRAGADYSFYPGPGGQDRYYLPQAVNAGSRWDRFDFSWPRLEPGNGVWDNSVLAAYDDLVSDLQAYGIDNIVGILLWTPNWAATQAGAAGAEAPTLDQRPFGWYAPTSRGAQAAATLSAASSPPQGLYEEWNDWTWADGDGINYWGRFVYQVVDRYSDRGVMYWEMWNEPEWTYFWTGTSTDYTRLLKVGYLATKAACSDCTVLFGGLHYWANRNYFRWVLNQINQDPAAPNYNYYFDVMSVHLYSRSSSIYTEIAKIRSGMTTYHVGDHPIWLTETGVPVWNDASVDPNPTKYDYAATQDEAAAYLIQSYANAWAIGVGRYFFFRTNDQDMSEYFGLMRNDRSLRPAYTAFQVAATYLISPTFTTIVTSSGGTHWNVTLWGTPRGRVSVLWNAAPTTAVYTLPAVVGTATRVNRQGVTQTIAAVGGVYTFTLPGATANLVDDPGDPNDSNDPYDYIIGGDPVIVIESEPNSAPPTSTVHPLPAVTRSPTFTVSWEGYDAGTGVWFYDVQARDGPSGAWMLWKQAVTTTQAQFTGGQHGHTYYFRSRATDRVGNQEAWPLSPQASIMVDLSRPLTFGVGAFFADQNCSGARDLPITATGEITLTGVALRFRDAAGLDVVSPTVGNAWTFTATVVAGQTYYLWAVTGEYMRALPVVCPLSNPECVIAYPELGLWPITRRYLPLVIRGD